MKKLIIPILMATVFCLGSARAFAGTLDALPGDLQEKIELMLATRYPPELKSISISPEAPAAGEAVTVTAKIYNDSAVTDDEISSVNIMYSTDEGATWQEVEGSSDDDKTWTAEIPAQDSGVKVIYAIKAIDSSTNYFVDIPCKTPEFPAEGYLDAACVSSEDPTTACATALPAGCMVPLSRDDDPLNDEEDAIPSNADFMDYKVGFNDDEIFIDLVTEDKATKGTTSPMDIRANAVALINRDSDAKGGDLDTLLQRGAVVVSAPLASIAGGVVKECFYGTQKGNSFDQNDKAVKCKMTGNHIIFTMKRDELGKNDKTHQFNLFAVGAHITSISPIAGGVFDNNHWTTINLVEDESRTYTVQ